MTTRAVIFRASKFAKFAKFAMIAAAATALSACWYYSRPTQGASGENCQKTSYGLAMLDTSNENCQPSAESTTANPPATMPPAAPQ
ncbi:MAG TPA: hypothetical protein VNF27_14500 [Candidatus Binataceae bacterium]|nr:hypothetical protein [Candidatus Binataceae bacterium]